MNLAMCVIALALMGTDDPSLAKTPASSAPLGIEIEIELGGPAAQSTSQPLVAKEAAAVCATLSSCASAMRSAKVTALSETCQSTCDTVTAPVASEPETQEIWPMTVQEAIAIALENSEIVRVISLGDRGKSGFGCTFFATAPKPPPRPPLPAEVPDGVENDGRSFVIARLNADTGRFRFRSEVMAHIRSVEQQYWALSQAHAALRAADRAVNLVQDVVETIADAELHCGHAEELAEAGERLEQFNQALVDRTSDVIAAERAFRKILGLPGSDNRRIIPIDPPTQAPLEPDWETCLDAMMHTQPDVVQQTLLTRLAELQLLIARNPGLPQVNLNTLYQMNAMGEMLDSPEDALMATFLDGLELGSPKQLKRLKKSLARSKSDAVDILDLVARETGESPRKPLTNVRREQYAVLRARAFLTQVVHQTTHSLARGLLEVDAGYKSYATARRLRAAAALHLEAQRVYWEEGRITTDRFLDAVEQYSAAVATEHCCLAAYNSAIVFLSESKGTLLADHNIVVAEPHRPDNAQQTAGRVQDEQARKASFTPAETRPRKPTFLEIWQVSTCPWLAPSLINVPDPKSSETESEPAPPEPSAKPKAATFSISIGGPNGIHIQGSIPVDSTGPDGAGSE